MILFERNGTQYRMPRRTFESIQRYVQYGVPTGDFLKAVLSNDLFGAFDRADEENWECLGDICRYIYNHIPSNAWRSIEKINNWLLHKLEEREKEAG